MIQNWLSNLNRRISRLCAVAARLMPGIKMLRVKEKLTNCITLYGYRKVVLCMTSRT